MKKLFLYVFLGLMFCNVGFAECIEGDCNNGYGTYTWADGSKYVGEHKDGKGHGQGTYTWADGDKYVGEYKDGKQHGQGTFTWASGEFAGNKYVGEYKDGEPQGPRGAGRCHEPALQPGRKQAEEALREGNQEPRLAGAAAQPSDTRPAQASEDYGIRHSRTQRSGSEGPGKRGEDPSRPGRTRGGAAADPSDRQGQRQGQG